MSTQLDRPAEWETDVGDAKARGAGLPWVHLELLVAGLLCWLVAVSRISADSIDGWGLLPGLPVLWWVALAIAVVPQLLAAMDETLPRWVLLAYQALLILVLLGTTSAAYPVPRFPWTYKHIGVVQYLIDHGTVDRNLDIYHSWPGFFALAAGLSVLTGISPLTMARWAEPVFCFATICAMTFALRSIVKDRRVLAVAALLFVLGSWTGANYFSPQAFAMVLALVFLGVFLRTFPARAADGGFVPRRLVARLLRGAPLAPAVPLEDTSSTISLRVGSVTTTLLWCCLVVSHQLTPYALLVVLGVLVVVIRVRQLWFVAVWAALAVLWTALALPILTRNGLTLVNSDAVSGLAPPTAYIPEPVLPGMGLTGVASAVLLIAFPLAGGVAVLWQFFGRREAWLVPAVLGYGSGLVLLVQSYGGEAIYRFYLYGLPWWSLLLATFVVAFWRPARFRQILVSACAAVLSVVSVTAGLGQEIDYYVDPGDVRASQWLESNADYGSFVLTVTGLGFPLRVTSSYPNIQYSPVSLDVYDPHPLAGGAAGVLDQFPTFSQQLKGTGYLVITNSQRTYGRAYATVTDAQWDNLEASVSKSSDFQVIYNQDGDFIARYLGSPAAGR